MKSEVYNLDKRFLDCLEASARQPFRERRDSTLEKRDVQRY